MLSTVLPAVFFSAFKLHVFALRSCSTMKLFLVTFAALPLVLLVRTLRSAGGDATERRLRLRMIGIFASLIALYTVVSPGQVCAVGTDQQLGFANLAFETVVMFLAYV